MTTEELHYLATADYKQLDALKKKNEQLNDQASKDTPAAQRKTSQGFDDTSRKAGFLALGIAGLGVAAFKSAADYSSAMNVWQTVTKATVEGKYGLNAAKKLAVELGNDLSLPGVSARDAADAMVELGKGGMSAKESMQSVKGVMQLAKTANMEMGEAATFVARSIKAYGLKAKDAAAITDNLAAASIRSTAGVDDLAEGFKFAQGPAKVLGVDFDDTATALAILNDNGVAGARAGTALGMMFRKLASPTEKGRAAMEKLGINVFDASGKFIGMEGATKQLHDALGPLNQAQRLQALQAIGAGQAQQAMNVFADQGVKKWKSYNKSVNESGSANKLLKAQTKGAGGALDQMASSVDTLKITFGEKLVPAMLPVIKNLTKLLSILGGHPKLLATVATATFVLATSIWAVNKAFKAYYAIRKLIDNLKKLQLITKIQTAYQKTMIVVTKLQTIANRILGASFWTALGPILLIIAAVALLAIGFYVLWKKSETFRKIVYASLEAVTGAAKAFYEMLQVALNWVIDNWPLIVGAMLGPLGLIVAAIGTDAFGIRTKLTDAIQGILTWVTDHFADFYNKGLELIGKLASGLVDGLAGIGEAAWNVINNIWTTISGYYQNVVNWGRSIGEWIKDAVVAGVTGVGNAAWGIIDNIWTTISGFVERVKGWGVNVGTWIKNAVVDGVTGIGERAWNIINNIADWISDKAKSILGWGKSIASSLINGIVSGIRSTAGKVMRAIQKYVTDKLPGWVKGPLGIHSPSAVTAKIGAQLMQGMALGIKSAGVLALDEAARQAALISNAMNVQGQVGLRVAAAGAAALGAGAAAAGAGPLVHIENVNVSEEDDARRLAKKLSASLAVRA